MNLTTQEPAALADEYYDVYNALLELQCKIDSMREDELNLRMKLIAVLNTSNEITGLSGNTCRVQLAIKHKAAG